MPAVATTAPSRPEGPAARRRSLRQGAGPAVVALAAAATALRLPAYLADRHLTVDDGVFGASAVAMRHGGVPFRDVFSSQGPLFLPLVWAADLLGLRTLNAPRLLGLASTVVLVLATLALGRHVAGPRAGLVAAGLVAVTGSVLWVTGPLAADGPALALAVLAVALALPLRERPSTGRAVAAGAALGAALCIKALLVPAAVPIGLVLVADAGRRRRLLGPAVGAALAVAVLTHVPWGLADVWDQSYDYHLDAAGERTPVENAGKVLGTLADRDLPVVGAGLLALGTWALARRGGGDRTGTPADHPAGPGGRTPGDGLLLWGWLGATALVLLAEHPLWRPHVAYLVPPLALLAARRLPALPVLAVAAVLVLPVHAVRLAGVLLPDPPSADEQAVEAELRALPEGAQAISDQPGLVWRADRRTPPDAVDASRLRLDSGRVTASSLARLAAADEVCAVAVWSDRYAGLEELPGRLRATGYDVRATYGGPRTLWVKDDCEPAPA